MLKFRSANPKRMKSASLLNHGRPFRQSNDFLNLEEVAAITEALMLKPRTVHIFLYAIIFPLQRV